MQESLLERGGNGVCVRRLGVDRAGQMRITRFVNNDNVTVEEMVATAAGRLAQRCAGRHVLAIQDTTVLKSAGGGGLYLHPVVAVDAQDGAILGLAHAQFMSRSCGKAAQRRKKAVKDKESQRWLDGAQAASRACAGAARITVVADRESDIYAAFAQRPDNVDLLVRAAQDRSLGDDGRLFAAIDALQEAGRTQLSLPAQAGRKTRVAILAVRFTSVTLKRPKNAIGKDLPKTGLAKNHQPVCGGRARDRSAKARTCIGGC